MSAVRAAILITGSEILLGRTRDANSSFLARDLDAHGVRLERILAVDDQEQSIINGLEALLASRVDLLITSGGLGPTHDDRTVSAVAAVTGRKLVIDPDALAMVSRIVTEFARRRGVPDDTFRVGTQKQATIPTGAHVIEPAGTAPGLVVAHNATRIVVLPGPPSELAVVWPRATRDRLVEPLLRRSAQPRRIIRLYGVAESIVADQFQALGGETDGIEATICASRGEIELILRYPPSAVDAANRIADGLVAAFPDQLFAQTGDPIEALLVNRLRERRLTLATAESCTAGLVAARIADVPGASSVLVGGIVAYANDAKTSLLGVPGTLLADDGAVSAACARAMAIGACERFRTTVAVAVTGIAGPDGATATKPVGLVYLHAVTAGGERALERRYHGARDTVRDYATSEALHLVDRLVGDTPG
jgi:nicotinamide-nucleotide amidase